MSEETEKGGGAFSELEEVNGKSLVMTSTGGERCVGPAVCSYSVEGAAANKRKRARRFRSESP